MKLKEYMELHEPGAEVTCWDKDIDSEFYFYNKEIGKKSLFGDEFPNVSKCDELLRELLDVVKAHDGGIDVNLYELLDNPKIIEFAKKNMFEEHQYEDDSDIVMMLFDDNVKNFAYGYEGFSELMVECLKTAFNLEQGRENEREKAVFNTTDSELTQYNGTVGMIIKDNDKVIVSQAQLAQLLGYVGTLLDFIDVESFEDKENVALVRDGYDNFVKPLEPAAYGESNYDEGKIAKKYDIDMFKENLSDIYDVDISKLSHSDISDIYEDVMETLAGDDSYSESYNSAVHLALKEFEYRSERVSLDDIISAAAHKAEAQTSDAEVGYKIKEERD